MVKVPIASSSVSVTSGFLTASVHLEPSGFVPYTPTELPTVMMPAVTPEVW